MARTFEYLSRVILKENGVERDVHEVSNTLSSVSRFLHQVISLRSSTVNYQVSFGSGFTTPTRIFLREQAGRTFTYSVGANSRHHLVAANGAAFLHGSIASLFFSNNSTNATAALVELVAVR